MRELLQRLFKLKENETTIRTELRGGVNVAKGVLLGGIFVLKAVLAG